MKGWRALGGRHPKNRGAQNFIRFLEIRETIDTSMQEKNKGNWKIQKNKTLYELRNANVLITLDRRKFVNSYKTKNAVY